MGFHSHLPKTQIKYPAVDCIRWLCSYCTINNGFWIRQTISFCSLISEYNITNPLKLVKAMKGLINFAVTLPTNQHIKKKKVLSIKMYIVVQGRQRYICLPRVSPRSATSVRAGVDPALGCGFGSIWGENQITDPFSKDPSRCRDHRNVSYLPSSTGRGLHLFLEGTRCCLQWGHLSRVRPGWSSPRARTEGPEGGSPQPAGELRHRERSRWDFCRCRLWISVVCKIGWKFFCFGQLP